MLLTSGFMHLVSCLNGSVLLKFSPSFSWLRGPAWSVVLCESVLISHPAETICFILLAGLSLWAEPTRLTGALGRGKGGERVRPLFFREKHYMTSLLLRSLTVQQASCWAHSSSVTESRRQQLRASWSTFNCLTLEPKPWARLTGMCIVSVEGLHRGWDGHLVAEGVSQGQLEAQMCVWLYIQLVIRTDFFFSLSVCYKVNKQCWKNGLGPKVFWTLNGPSLQSSLPTHFMQVHWWLAEKNIASDNTGVQTVRLSCLSVCPFVTLLWGLSFFLFKFVLFLLEKLGRPC